MLTSTLTQKPVALLVMAATAPKVLSSLLRCATQAPFKVFVHVDAKLDLEKYKANMDNPPYLPTFIDVRHDIFWGGFSMIRATIALMKSALADKDIEVLTLISDDTFFLVSPLQAYQALIAEPIRIDIHRITEEHPRFQRYAKYYFFDSHFSSVRQIEPESRNIDPLFFFEIAERMRLLYTKGKWHGPLRMGAQWWSMSRELAGDIINIYESQADIVSSFEFSAIPDESFFQTLALLKLPSEYKPLYSPMLYDFERNPKPFIFRDEGDIAGLSLADKLFLRKVAPDSFFTRRF